ncbi:HEAT repeat domain-containing protein [Streptomyces sp. NPDC059071]|uniref:HEAT repeat domain-containing protein n=1 Tax=unclassified Streptomyces TaxID=2593676 RepID=UPI00365EBF7C
MELADPLDGLEAHPWASTSHAYGSAEAIPDLLRALTDTDTDAAASDEALSELYGSLLHQGTVYAASAEAAPFLAGIAAAGHRTADVLALLGGMAESEDEHGVAPGRVRAAVAGQLTVLLPLLSDDDPAVRRAAAWAVSHTRTPGTVLPALRARWAKETEPDVRAEVLAGISRLDPRRGAAEAASVLDPSQSAVVRLAAVFACLDAGAPWNESLQAAMLSLLPADCLRSEFDFERGEPLAAVVEALLDRDDEPAREAAFALVRAALRDGRAEVRSEGLWAADRACMLSRSAARHLVESLRAAALDEAAVLRMASLLERLAGAAEPAADVLVPLAGRNPDQEDDHADRALAALVRVAPDRAAPLLAAGLGRRPRALDAATGRWGAESGRWGAASGPWEAVSAAFPYHVGLLDAVRRRLSRPATLGGNEPAQLCTLLAGWGAEAAAALPELSAAIPHLPGPACRALASVAADCAPSDRAVAVAALRAAARRGVLAAAKALDDLTDDPALLLGCLEQELGGGGWDVSDAAGIAAGLGSRAAVLAPLLRGALSDPGTCTTRALDTDTALAEALWRVTGDPDPAVAVLASVFDRAAQSRWTRWSVARAARATALLGPAGRSLTARLEAALDDPAQAPAAVLALVAVSDPAALDHAALASAALASAEADADPTGACDALEALGGAALNADHLSRLAALADGDARVIRSGVEPHIIRQDEAFRARARTLLTTFRQATEP